MSATVQTPRVGNLPFVPAHAQPLFTIATDPSTNRTVAVWGEVGTSGRRPGRVIAEWEGQGPEAIREVALAATAWLAAAFS